MLIVLSFKLAEYILNIKNSIMTMNWHSELTKNLYLRAIRSFLVPRQDDNIEFVANIKPGIGLNTVSELSF
mgnify:CR=1|jgi:hypothetical protein